MVLDTSDLERLKFMFKSISQIIPKNASRLRIKEGLETSKLFKKAEMVLRNFGFKNTKATAMKNKVLIINLNHYSEISKIVSKEKEILKKIEIISGEKIDSIKFKVKSKIHL